MDDTTQEEVEPKTFYPVRIYIVFQRNNVAYTGEPNIRVVACKLNWSSAQAVVDKLPGAYIEKVYANKIHSITPLVRPKRE